MQHSTIPCEKRLWSPAFCMLFILNIMTSVAFYMTMPTLPRYAVSIGMSLALSGILTGIFSIVAIFARPIAGTMADRGYTKILLIGATLLTALAAFGYSLTKNVPFLFIWRILHGACFAISSTVQLTLTSTLVPEVRLGEGLGYMGISQILAQSFAPSAGLELVNLIGYHGMFRFSAMLFLIGGMGMYFLPYRNCTQTAETMAFKEFLRPRHLILTNLIILSAIGGLFSLMNGVVSSYLTMLGDLHSIDNASLFFTVSSIAVLLIRPFSGKMADRKGLMYVMIPSLLLGASSMFCISSAWSIAPILTAALLKGAAQSSGQNAIQAECARRSPANRRGVAMSTCYLGNDLGNSFGAMLGGWLSGSVGYGKMFGIIGGIMLMGLGMLYIQKRIDAANVQ